MTESEWDRMLESCESTIPAGLDKLLTPGERAKVDQIRCEFKSIANADEMTDEAVDALLKSLSSLVSIVSDALGRADGDL